MTQQPAPAERHWGQISDAAIGAVRSRIGIPVKSASDRSLFDKITADSIRTFATAAGDVNPLYSERDYAAATRWGAPIAPGTILFATGIPEGRPVSPRERDAGRGGAFPGVHGMFSGADWEFYLPLLAGDEIFSVGYLAEVQEKQGRFAGREILELHERVYRNQQGAVVAKVGRTRMRTERDTAAKKGKYKSEPQRWTDEELAEVDAAYERETARGRDPRYWEDVEIGEEIPTMVRGPFTGTDAIAWKMGWGFEPFIRTGKIAYDYRQRHPDAYPRNDLNIPDVPERVHWDHDMAREVGVPGYYDYGPQRVAWLGNLMTNWIGDDGWLKRLSVQVRRFNIEGDVQWLKGRVINKGVRDGEHFVECDIWAENQRGEVTAPGSAIALLPSREHGPVQLPAHDQPAYPTWDGPEGRVTPTQVQQ